MDTDKQTILLKLSGEFFALPADKVHLHTQQMVQLARHARLGIVVGGGNVFRGSQHGTQLGLPTDVGHEIGMLATLMNGKMLSSLLALHGQPAHILSAVPCATMQPISSETIANAFAHHNVIVFAGGTGNPFVTTDTAAVIRSLQIGATQLWKATTVDGIYDKDPRTNTDAKLLSSIRYEEAIAKQLGFMDLAALALAAQHKLSIRVFNYNAHNALEAARTTSTFGSTLH